jgi:hypothetical protein
MGLSRRGKYLVGVTTSWRTLYLLAGGRDLIHVSRSVKAAGGPVGGAGSEVRRCLSADCLTRQEECTSKERDLLIWCTGVLVGTGTGMCVRERKPRSGMDCRS